jgi:TolB-like protein/DNA-binding SARP family transcriptional activator/Flp pilus assembly protein TadD
MPHRLALFGSPSIEGSDGPVSGRAVQRRRLALLALIASSSTQGRGRTRDQLASLLWPDADPERGRHLLSDSIYRVNQALGGEALAAVGDELRLDPAHLACDVVEFAEAMAREDWAAAVKLQVAPFLDGFLLPDAGEFERWAAAERERLRRERARALEALAESAASEGRTADAVHWWRTLAADDPCNSRVAVSLMEALARAGNPAAAVRHARTHALLVLDELGVEPDPAVPALAERIERGEGPRPAGPSAQAHDPGEGRGGPGLESPTHPSASPDPPDLPLAPPLRRARVGALAAGFGLLAVFIGALSWSELRSPVEVEAVGSLAIAVLPFEDLSPDADQGYLADGMTEELMVLLSRVDGLSVVGRTSSRALRDGSDGLREVARLLDVGLVLGGSVLRSGERLRVFAQLVDAETGYQLWSERYERGQADVFEIQDEIARAIVGRLRDRLGPEATPPGPSVLTADLEAYNLYLRGRFEWHRRTEAGLRAAAVFFEEAVARDSSFARGHAGLGDAYAVLGFYDYLPPRDAFPRAERAARRALELDPSLAEPHATLGYTALYHDWDGARAEAAFLRSLELDPGYSTGHQWYANLLTAQGRFDEAVREMRRAQELDPLSLIANAALGWILFHAGAQDEAVAQLERTLAMAPDYVVALLWKGLALSELGRPEEGLAPLERAVEVSGGSAIVVAGLARVAALAGDAPRARALVEGLVDARPDAYLPAYEIAAVHAALGDPAEAVAWLERGYRERSHSMVFLAVDPQLDSLRGLPAFERLVERVGLTRATP